METCSCLKSKPCSIVCSKTILVDVVNRCVSTTTQKTKLQRDRPRKFLAGSIGMEMGRSARSSFIDFTNLCDLHSPSCWIRLWKKLFSVSCKPVWNQIVSRTKIYCSLRLKRKICHKAIQSHFFLLLNKLNKILRLWESCVDIQLFAIKHRRKFHQSAPAGGSIHKGNSLMVYIDREDQNASILYKQLLLQLNHLLSVHIDSSLPIIGWGFVP